MTTPVPRPAELALVAVGGSAGSLARAAVAEWLDHPAGAWAWSTLVVNIVGSLLLAALLTGLPAQSRGRREVRLLVGTGLLGGFTTFSTFVMDADAMARHSGAGQSAVYVGVSLGSMLLAGAAGWLVGGWALRRAGGTS